MIRVSNLSKLFGSLEAVSGLNFEVMKGEIFGIVGPDGAGKSTLLRLLAGILPPDSGDIKIQEIDILKNKSLIREKMAYMPQRFGLYEDLTVEENIIFFGKLFGLSVKEIKKQEERLLEFSQLAPFKNRLAEKLSGGMKQKLGLACCLIHQPELILLDEPTNGVDPVSRREFWRILYDLLSEGVTIIVATAYLDEAERCNRIALMSNGKFMELDFPKHIKDSMNKTLIEIETDDIWKAEEIIRGSREYSNIIREGKALRLFVDDKKKEIQKIKKFLKQEDVGAIKIKEKMPSLENCFLEITAQEKHYGNR